MMYDRWCRIDDDSTCTIRFHHVISPTAFGSSGTLSLSYPSLSSMPGNSTPSDDAVRQGTQAAAEYPRLPLEIVLRVAEHLRSEGDLLTLSHLLQTSRDIDSLLTPILYDVLELNDDQLGLLISSLSAGTTRTRQTRWLTIISPLSSTTATHLTALPHQPFPQLDKLTLSSAVLKALPHDKPAMSTYDTSRSFKKKCTALTSHLGPYRQLAIIPTKSEECVFEILHPILPTSLGLSSFLPRLAMHHPQLKVVRYEGFHADLIYPTSRVRTEYRDVCECWLKYGAERLGLGIRLAWADTLERRDDDDPRKRFTTTIEIHASGQQQSDWNRFQDRVIEYMREGGQDLHGRLEFRDGVERLKCLTVYTSAPG